MTRRLIVMAAAAALAALPVAAAPQEGETGPAARSRNGGYLGLFLRERDGTVTIERVHPGGPAAKAGFRAGDVIETVNARPLRNGDELVKAMWSRRPLRIAVRRGDATVTIETSTPRLDAKPAVGDRAPDFTLPARTGTGTHALKALCAKGRPVVLVFGSFT